MSFDQFLQTAWKEHADDAEAVASRFAEGIALLEKPEQVPAFARLVLHVEGEHLGRWQKGRDLLTALRASPHFSGQEAESALRRGEAVLMACERGSLPSEGLTPSERVRALATAASSLSAHAQGERAEAFFRQALQLSGKLPKEDPANRDLAIASNNLALALEERKNRAFRDTELMLMAAHAARKFWEISGTWLEVERAEYRLARSFLAAGKPHDALRHAETCLEVCSAHDAAAIELFFAQEAMALALFGAGQEELAANAVGRAGELFARLPEEEKPWCREPLSHLEKLGAKG
jgi:hypothetical protein